MLTCLRTNMSWVLMCSRAKVSWVLMCSCNLRAYVAMCLACLGAHVPTCLACLRAHVPTCLACFCAQVLICFLAPFLSFPYEIKSCMKNVRKTCRYDTRMSLDTFILNIQLYTSPIKWLDFCLSATLRVIFKSLINSGRWILTGGG